MHLINNHINGKMKCERLQIEHAWSYTTTDEYFGLGYTNEHFGLFEIDEMLL